LEKKVSLTFIAGENVELWAPSVENVELYAKWINLPSGRLYSRTPLPQSISQLKKILEPQSEDSIKTSIYFEIYHKKDMKSIGIVGLSDINWLNRNAHFFVNIGEPEYWGKGLAVESLKLLIIYSFEDLNLHKLYTGVFTPNKQSIRVLEKLGLIHEATLKEEMYVDGTYYDALKYRVFKKEWFERMEK